MSETTHTLRLGTRGSLLAKTQSQLVASELEKRHKGLVVELVVLKTTADPSRTSRCTSSGEGLFTKELEQALQRNEIDLAVHSFKDVPVTQPLVAGDDLVHRRRARAGGPARRLLLPDDQADRGPPREAKVGTSSLRAQVPVARDPPDLKVEVLRGNIDTRLRKLRDGAFDAIILAAAGLRRTGLFNEAEMAMLEIDQMLPAPGQGALAIQCRRNDERTRDLLGVLDHPETERCVTAERVIVQALGGDCHSPIGALALCNGRHDDAESGDWLAWGCSAGRPGRVRLRRRALRRGCQRSS
jgi:hydroxymethylbilane synthase